MLAAELCDAVAQSGLSVDGLNFKEDPKRQRGPCSFGLAWLRSGLARLCTGNPPQTSMRRLEEVLWNAILGSKYTALRH